jgi:hypothetical protein
MGHPKIEINKSFLEAYFPEDEPPGGGRALTGGRNTPLKPKPGLEWATVHRPSGV